MKGVHTPFIDTSRKIRHKARVFAKIILCEIGNHL